MSAADAQRFDTVGEGLVGSDAGSEGDVGPVLVELAASVVDRVAPPTVVLLVVVVGDLLASQPLESGERGGDGSGGVDRGDLPAVQFERGEYTDLREVLVGVVDGALGVLLALMSGAWWLVATTNSQGDHNADLLPFFALIPLSIANLKRSGRRVQLRRHGDCICA